MESQIVVDHTEVDANGYVIGGVGNESHPMDQLCEVKYMLRLESRELRDRSKQLKKRLGGTRVDEVGDLIDSYNDGDSCS
jgi:hypothetical protein